MAMAEIPLLVFIVLIAIQTDKKYFGDKSSFGVVVQYVVFCV